MSQTDSTCNRLGPAIKKAMTAGKDRLHRLFLQMGIMTRGDGAEGQIHERKIKLDCLFPDKTVRAFPRECLLEK